MHMEYEVRSMKYKACSRDMHMEWSLNSIWNVLEIFYAIQARHYMNDGYTLFV